LCTTWNHFPVEMVSMCCTAKPLDVLNGFGVQQDYEIYCFILIVYKLKKNENYYW